MSLDISEIILGLDGGQTYRLELNSKMINVIISEEAYLWRNSIVDILSSAGLRKDFKEAPFVRVRLDSPNLSIAIADDMQAGLRIFEESLEQRIPLIIDASVDSRMEAPKLDLMLTKLAQGFGLAQEELVRVALTQIQAEESEEELLSIEKEFLSAHSNALSYASQVRRIDDQMTASVVPGWLFIACAVGAAFVLMTAITLFYPELRMTVIPIMVIGGIVGLGAYGWRSWKELNIRGALQTQRAELRAKREEAKTEARALAEQIVDENRDPDALLARQNTELLSAKTPIVLEKDVVDLKFLEEMQTVVGGRQLIVFGKSVSGVDDGGSVKIIQPEVLSMPS
ncbi:MAG: hypothetical protein VYC39_08470 [Myxococcota bacterium]|nr:hypothetical protein [Myxococcota bacterium]